MKRLAMPMFMMVSLAAANVTAEEPRQPAGGTSAQAAGQAGAEVRADGDGAAASGAAASSGDAAAGDASASLAQGTEVSAVLTRPVDAGRDEPGDEVTAKSAEDIRSGGEVVVPRGSKLVGRVTEARPRARPGADGEGASALGIVFDRAILRDGRTVALNGSVAAVAAARSAAATAGGAPRAGGMAGAAGSAGGGLAGTVGGAVGGIAGATTGVAGDLGATVGAATDAATRSSGAVGGLDVTGALRAGSRGVFGIRDLEITGDAAGGAGSTLITSADRNVRLDSGTQLLLVAGARAAQEPAEAARSTEQPSREAREARKDTR